MNTLHVSSLALALALLAACEVPAADPDGALRDGGRDGGGDTTELCATDRDCADGDWCNGDEACFPGATDADERGCVAASAPRCGDAYDCDAEARECVTRCEVALDADGDGHIAIACGGDDCDDNDPNRYPGNIEVCDADGHDEDCNPESIGSLDEDGDGSIASICCNGDFCGDDCNDRDSAVNPRVGDVCDGVDNDCSGAADEGCACRPGETRECGSEAALARIGICRPGNQVCVMGELTAGCIGAIEPLEEICDGTERDEDCDGRIDEGVRRTYYRDADGDGYGAAGETISACSAPDGWASNAFDCDDSLAPVNPGVPEICNERDDDCDGRVDEGLLRTYYLDADGDGFGATATTACSPPSAMHVERGGDCDDGRAGASPVGIESCNGEDDDCDGRVDEGVLRTYYLDEDGDGVGGTTSIVGCAPPAGYVAIGGDCADTDAARYPGRIESCNGVDDDCDGAVDPGCACTDGATQPCGPPATVGRCVRGTQVCVGGRWGECGGAVMGSTETCNGIDDDCDGTTDEGTIVTGCRGDADGDGYGAGATSTQCRDATRASAGYCPAGFTTSAGDCNDANAAVRPMGNELCNGADDDCDGLIDEGVTASGCYADADGDGYGIGAASTQCRDPARASYGHCPFGFTNRGGDCNDAASSVRPGAPEACNGLDDDCSGVADDGPGMICALGTTRAGTGAYGTCASVGGTFACSSCTSEIFTPSPPPEICDGLDNDCDGARDEAFACEQGTSGHACVTACGTVGTRSCSASCTFTGQLCRGTEVCNGCDDDGNGVADDTFACVAGQTRSCTRMCGATALSGTQRCLPDCSGWSACTLPEVCNGCDDDGDGNIDNGFFCARDSISYCTTGCGTAGQRVCNSSCTAYLSSSCNAAGESCNYCDDDGDGDFDDDRPLATDTELIVPHCPSYTLHSTTGTCGMLGIGQPTELVNNVANDAGAAWLSSPPHLGWGPLRATIRMTVSKFSSLYVPGAGWALVLADGGTGDLGSPGNALGVPMGRTGIAIEWRFYRSDPNADHRDTITVRRLTGSGTGSILRAATDVPVSQDFGSGKTQLHQDLTVIYTPEDPSTIAYEERLQVMAGGVTLFTLTAPHAIRGLFRPGSVIALGVTAATGERVFRGHINADLVVDGEPPPTYIEAHQTCDLD